MATIEQYGNCGLSHYENCLVSYWFGPPRLGELEGHYRYARYMASQGHKFSLLLVLTERAPMPNAYERKILEAWYQKLAPQIEAAVTCLEGSGLLAIGLRGLMHGLNRLSPRPYPYAVEASVGDGAHWLGRKIGRGTHFEQQLESCVMALRKAESRCPPPLTA